MNLYAVDSSVALKWFLFDAPDESDTHHALDLLRGVLAEECRFVQPPHWLAEVMSVLARKRPAHATAAMTRLLELDCYDVIQTPSAYARAIALSVSLDHHLFDTFYHAVALEENAQLVTADRRYFNKAKKLGNILMLESVNLSKRVGR